MKKYILFLFFGFFLFNNCSNVLLLYKYLNFKDIQNQINAANDGDTVNISEGVCIFNTAITINKNITLKGAGTDKTIFYNYQKDESDSVLFIKNNNKTIRITGITFQGKGQDKNSSNQSQFIRWHNTSQAAQITGFRIDHCNFIDGGKYAISIWGADDIFGVIDHCTFTNASTECICVFGAGTGDLDWTRNEALGTEHAVFIEDCSFTYNKSSFPTGFCSAVVSNNGGRYVFRYNTISTIAALNSTQVDMHGNYYGDRGGYSAEIYSNKLYSDHSWCGIYMRGGRGLITNNDFYGSYNNPIVLANDGSYLPSASSPRDTSHPAPDQINNFDIWNNRLNGTAITDVPPVPDHFVLGRGNESTMIQVNTDYWESNHNGYSFATYPHSLNN
jgi:hypothetical protein